MLSTCLYITASSFQDLFCQHFLHCLLGIEVMPRYRKKIHILDNVENFRRLQKLVVYLLRATLCICH